MLGLIHVRIVHVRLAHPGHPQPTEANAQVIHDALWVHAPPAAGLEHVTARVAEHRVDLVLFLRNSEVDIEEQAQLLLRSAFGASAALRSWQVVSFPPPR
jgi:hypothetical protein